MKRAAQMRQPSTLLRLIVGFFVLGALIKGLAILCGSSAKPDTLHMGLGICLVLVSCAFMVWTASTWAKWFPAMCAYGAIKCFLAVVFGETISSGHVKVPASLALEALAIFVCLALLTFPYMSRVPTVYEAAALVWSIVAILLDAFNERYILALIVALPLVGIARFTRRFRPFQLQVPTTPLKGDLREHRTAEVVTAALLPLARFIRSFRSIWGRLRPFKRDTRQNEGAETRPR